MFKYSIEGQRTLMNMNKYTFPTKSVIFCHSLDVENIRVMFAFYSVPGNNSNLEIKIRHKIMSSESIIHVQSG